MGYWRDFYNPLEESEEIVENTGVSNVDIKQEQDYCSICGKSFCEKVNRSEVNPLYCNDCEFIITQPQDEVEPDGISQHGPGAKMDGGKVDMTYLMEVPRALRAICLVFMHGEMKYTRGGWQHVNNGIDRYTSAMLRHLFNEEGCFDKDSNLPVAAHIAWNALASLELWLRENPNLLPIMQKEIKRQMNDN